MYVYHQVPKEMIGDTLVPLNELEDISPKLHSDNLKKYEGRESVTQIIVHSLTCIWNDVLFLTAVPPAEWRRTFDTVGYQTDPLRFYVIDPNTLNLSQAVVSNGHSELPLELKDLAAYAKIPEKTIRYYRKKIRINQRFLWHHMVPQILYKGRVNISRAPIITV